MNLCDPVLNHCGLSIFFLVEVKLTLFKACYYYQITTSGSSWLGQLGVFFVFFTPGSITTGDSAENRLKAAPAWTEAAAERLLVELL